MRNMPCRGSKCAVPGCMNYRSSKGISFYKFPKDKDLCMQWIILTQKPRLEELLKTRGSDYVHVRYTVCSDHFQEKDFRNKNMLSQGIWRGTLPSLLLPKPKQIGSDGEQLGKVSRVLNLTNNVYNDSAANQVERKFTAGQESAELYFGENKHFSSEKPDQVSNRITVKEEPELRHEEISWEEHKPQVCDMTTVKVEPDLEPESSSSVEHRPQEPEYIEVKGEPPDVEEDKGPAEDDSASFW